MGNGIVGGAPAMFSVLGEAEAGVWTLTKAMLA
jgi:hypothetical protein